MAIFVYVTDRCRDEAQQHSLIVEVDRFRERVESTQSLSLFDPFPPPCHVKKKLGGRQSRLIADTRLCGEHTVVVFLALMIRSSRAYEVEFTGNPRGYWEQYFRDAISPDELSRFVEERTRLAPPAAKPTPSDIEYAFLYNAFTHHQDSRAEDMIYESHEWVGQATQDRVAKQLALLQKPCLDALSAAPGLHFHPVPGKSQWGAWALRSRNRLFLLALSTDLTADSAEATAQRLAGQLAGEDDTALLRASRRAYPALILADDELWIDLEKDPIANMALSPEESEVLESARRSEHPFPLFINGRAGSGKSTILQYLFADLLYFYLSRPETSDMSPPIYLTANGDLLRIARGLVERLLKSEATFTPQPLPESERDVRDVLDDAFREFQPHLLSLVPAEARKQRFLRSTRVDYTRFRRMWMERFGKDKPALRDFGPDLSWHVIRSYIKGMSSETYLEPDDYVQLPENQLTVTRETFKLVHDRVWLGWYQHELESRGLWDDQDLTRYVLDKGLAKPLAPAVVCDEAQDFTRLELELLLRLNVFSDRNLSPADIHRVPFAFAGDQFQTLNPTGFRWDAIKASFVEKFVFELNPASREGKVDLNYRELKFNYRSTHKIVRFGNHVQAMRAALFGLPDVRPQTAWAVEPASFPVVWFRAGDAEFWKRFRANPNFVILVPCNEGEEAEYVVRDRFLREHIKVEDGIPLNVLSVTRAKGCEYPAVIAYGFGSATEVDVLSELNANRPDARAAPDRSLPLQYFVNRVYVAVSRPKRRLIVIDTEAGLERVWQCAREQKAEAQMLSRIKGGPELWADAIEGMSMGDADDVTLETAGDPVENARAFEAEGLARRDAFLLRQAAQAYRSADDPAKARECLARALEAEGAYRDAGESFFDAGFARPDGVRCLWRAGAGGWQRLCERAKQFPQIQNELEYQWARLALGQPEPLPAAEVLTRFAQRLSTSDFAERCAAEPAWREAMGALLRPGGTTIVSQSATDEVWAQIVVALDRIQAAGVSIPPGASAQIYFAARRFREAIDLWDRAGEPKTRDYDRAKASVEPYPGRIMALSNLGLHSEIVASFDAAPEAPLTQEQAAGVIDALARAHRFDDAIKVAWKNVTGAPALQLALVANRAGRGALARQALCAGIVLLVRQEQWDPLSKLWTSGELAMGPDWGRSEIKAWIQAESGHLLPVLVRALARSDGLATSAAAPRRRIAEFLRRYLGASIDEWRDRMSVFEAGAALERCGRFGEAITFYEQVLSQSLTKEEKRFARQRLLVAKQKQLDHERQRGVSGKTKTLERELAQALASMRVKTVEEFGALPRLAPLELVSLASGDVVGSEANETSGEKPVPVVDVDGSAVGEGPIDIVVGTFRLEWSPKHHRCNITNAETMDTAFVKVNERACGGDPSFAQIGPGRWSCAAWGVDVVLPDGSGGSPGAEHACELEFVKLGVRVSLRGVV